MSESQTKAVNHSKSRDSSVSRDSLGHAVKVLFSCVSSKVIDCHAIYHMSHFTFHTSHVICQINAYVDPWDMLNNFCFHVYAQKSPFPKLQTCKTCKLAKLANLQIKPILLQEPPWQQSKTLVLYHKMESYIVSGYK